jgi:hypothetical protein
MKQLFIMAVAAGLLAALSVQQANAQYGDSLPMRPSGTSVSEEMLQRCAELDIPRAQCNDVTVLQAEKMEIAKSGEGSGTSMFATEIGQMVLIIGAIGAIFGGVAGAFYTMGRKAKQVPA